MGLWVHITSNGDGFLTVQGNEPVTTIIDLYAGWNLVSYPSETDRWASDALLGMGADWVAVYDPATPYIKDEDILGTVNMSPGNAYWVHVTADVEWSLDYT